MRIPAYRKVIGLSLLAVACMAPGHANAESLKEVLARAYADNPEIEAGRSELKATDELVPQARSGYLPTVQAELSASQTHSRNDISNSSRLTTQSAQLAVSQPLYRGGRTVAGIKQAQALVRAQRAQLFSTEQAVLLDTATAYFDVVRDQAVVDLTRNNVRVLGRQLQAARDRFEVGEVTRTDVAQAESRQERARADNESALGSLAISRAALFRVTGSQIESTLDEPDLTGYIIPVSLDEAIALAESQNPIVLSAIASHDASEYGIDLAEGNLLPTANLVGSLTSSNNPNSTFDWQNSASITANVTVPLYQAGAAHSQVREAKQTASQNFHSIENARRAAGEQAVASWESLTSSRATIRSRKAQVRASELALEGVREESIVGSRTTLDVLDAEQELLDAQVSLVRAQRDEWAAIFQLLSATGQLDPMVLNLDVPSYDPDVHYSAVENKWFGTDTLEEELHPNAGIAKSDADIMTMELKDGELGAADMEDMGVTEDPLYADDVETIKIRQAEAVKLGNSPPPSKPQHDVETIEIRPSEAERLGSRPPAMKPDY